MFARSHIDSHRRWTQVGLRRCYFCYIIPFLFFTLLSDYNRKSQCEYPSSSLLTPTNINESCLVIDLDGVIYILSRCVLCLVIDLDNAIVSLSLSKSCLANAFY